jgi:hypothetical protein
MRTILLTGLILLTGCIPLRAQEITPKAVKAIPVENVRVAVKEGKCPALTEETAGNECPAGMINYRTPDGRDVCLCYTDKPVVEKELDTAATPSSKRIKQLVCHLDNAETGKKEWSVRYVAQNAAVPVGCVTGAQSLLYAVSSGLPSSLVTQLQMLCAPCVVAPKSWGAAPYCIHPDWPGGCAESCKEVVP